MTSVDVVEWPLAKEPHAPALVDSLDKSAFNAVFKSQIAAICFSLLSAGLAPDSVQPRTAHLMHRQRIAGQGLHVFLRRARSKLALSSRRSCIHDGHLSNDPRPCFQSNIQVLANTICVAAAPV